MAIHMDLFHHVRTCTLDDLKTALSPTDFWYRYALPLAHSVEAVKYAICALGGAHRAFKIQDSEKHPAMDGLQLVSVQQYNQAIRHVNSLMNTATEEDIEVILTCCVIFISIENLHGRYAESLRHLKAGTSLLISLMSKGNELYNFQELESGSSDGVLRVKAKLPHDMAQTFCRLGNDVWGYIRQMIAPDLNFYAIIDDEISSRTGPFESVDAAEEAFHNVVKLFEADRTVSARMMMALAQHHHNESRGHMYFMPSHVPDGQHLMPPERLEAIYNNWSQRFDLFRLQLDESSATSQVILRTRSLAVDQALWTGWLKCKVWADYQQEDYEEILRRAESLVALDAFWSSAVFAFDGSLILSLAVPCVSSMDSDIQWRTIRLLRSFRRKEGIWDSQELADILEAMMIATSQGMVTTDMLPWDVPQLARLMDSFKLAGVHIPEGPLLLT
ncbi:hypothetical protein FSARC_9391 [Fusarium sarcochroum]|uniref:Uncharacterized protein n=1 Tax=Fusarium sarcochroum TaxID=1208366 RepID=A0A8H4X5G3_9HYPO|nr:hypothetical protein FSARC_9391 [Fusarium sarcochroum]